MHPVTLDAQFIKGEVLIETAPYPNGSTALRIVDNAGRPIATATVVVGAVPDPGNVFIKDWSENTGILAELQRVNVIGPVLRTLRAGYCTVYEAKLLLGQ